MIKGNFSPLFFGIHILHNINYRTNIIKLYKKIVFQPLEIIIFVEFKRLA